MEDKKYDKCPECGAPCEVVKKMDFDGNTPTIPYDEYSYHRAKQGPAWVKGAPTERKLYHARFKGHLSDDIHDGTIEPVKDPEYWQAIASGVRISIKDSHIIEYLDESGAAPSGEREGDAVAFAEWLRDNTVPDGAPKLFYKPDISRYSIQQLYDIFKQKKK